jgi:hypothetical protein
MFNLTVVLLVALNYLLGDEQYALTLSTSRAKRILLMRQQKVMPMGMPNGEWDVS